MPVSLFYSYTNISDVHALAARLRPLGPSLDLAGRIRLSTEGINATFGGTEQAVQAFHDVVLAELHQPDIDFKLAEGSKHNFPEGWIVRVCKELVTLGVAPELALWQEAAPHLDPVQFKHEIDREEKEGKVILDVRNSYEHAIGRFKDALLPPIRQFSEFPKYVKENQHLFRDKRVLMYCTGGIRCERASAYLKNVGNASSVAQLKGGIDRFLKAYPDGAGLFQGKNLVFDTRMAVPTVNPKVVGRCLCCACPWDDYTSDWRCSHCRGRVLICDKKACTDKITGPVGVSCLTCRNY